MDKPRSLVALALAAIVAPDEAMLLVVVGVIAFDGLGKRKFSRDLYAMFGSLVFYYSIRVIARGYPLGDATLDYIRLFLAFLMIQGIVKIELYFLSIFTTFMLCIPLKSGDVPSVSVPLFIALSALTIGSNLEVFKREGYTDVTYLKRLWLLQAALVPLYFVLLVFEFHDQIDLSVFKLPRATESNTHTVEQPSTLTSSKDPESSPEPLTRTVLDKICIPPEVDVKTYEI